MNLPPLRLYQEAAVEAVYRELTDYRSTAAVMATGTGKTRIAAEVLKDWPGRRLFIAHRDELIQQAMARIEEVTGEMCDLEQAGFYANGAKTVVASIQTLLRRERRERFRPDSFDLIVVDEVHHYVSPSWRAVLDYFRAAKVLGITATPDRTDRLALGSLVESVAFVYDIADAILDGWLCPIRAKTVKVQSIDLSQVKTKDGDLNIDQLDAVMATEKNLHGVARPTVELSGDRPTIVFTTSVANAHRLAEILNRYKPGSARSVDGETPRDERRAIVGGYRSGAFQYLVNFAISTEGFDAPLTSCIVMGRPTKSRLLHTQMIGRGTRIAPGKVDLLVVDFAGNAGRHKLVCPLDILAGRWPDEVIARARRITERKEGMSLVEACALAERLLAAEREAAERRSAARARVVYQARDVDPFKVFGVEDPAKKWGGQFGGKPASEKQLAYLKRMRIPVPDGCTGQQAGKLIGEAHIRRAAGLASYGKMRVLARHGIDATRMSDARASAIMDALKANRWRPIPLARLDALTENRTPGEEG